MASTALFGVGSAYADEGSQCVEFTPEFAEIIAGNFVVSAGLEKDLVISDITPFYDEYERLLGYIACFEKKMKLMAMS